MVSGAVWTELNESFKGRTKEICAILRSDSVELCDSMVGRAQE